MKIYKDPIAEWIGDGGRIQLPLVRGFRISQDFRANRLPAVPEVLGDIWGQVLYCLLGLVCIGRYNCIVHSSYWILFTLYSKLTVHNSLLVIKPTMYIVKTKYDGCTWFQLTFRPRFFSTWIATEIKYIRAQLEFCSLGKFYIKN